MTAPAEPRSGGEAEELARAALAVVQSAQYWARTMVVPGFQIEKLRQALAAFEQAEESSPAWTSEAPKVPGWWWWGCEDGQHGLARIDDTLEAWIEGIASRDGSPRSWCHVRKAAEWYGITRWSGPLVAPPVAK